MGKTDMLEGATKLQTLLLSGNRFSCQVPLPLWLYEFLSLSLHDSPLSRTVILPSLAP